MNHNNLLYIRKKQVQDILLDLIFPRRCPVCFDVLEDGNSICPECVKKLLPVKDPSCLCCGKELRMEESVFCEECQSRGHSFRRNFPVFIYTDVASRSMSAIKYKNKKEFLDFYEEALWQRWGRMLQIIQVEAVIPVPIHPSRRRQRGFNQAEVIAKKLAERLKIPCLSDGLVRVKKTAPQKILSPKERKKNLENAFAIGNIPKGIENVLLVDDIYTTGTTLETCSNLLKSNQISVIYTVTLFIVGKKS